MDFIILILVFLVGVLAAFIGVIAGGGGLISIPMLIFLGLDPKIAIATAKLGGLGGVMTSAFRYHKSSKINFKIGYKLLVLFTIASVLGSFALVRISEETMYKIVGIVLLGLLPLILFSEKGLKEIKTGKRGEVIGYILMACVGFYCGFFGGGWGILSYYVMIMFFGLDFVKSAATTVFGSLGSYPLSLIVFAANGMINYEMGIVLMLGMMIGGYLGAKTAVKKGNKFVRILFIIVVIASAVKLLFG